MEGRECKERVDEGLVHYCSEKTQQVLLQRYRGTFLSAERVEGRIIIMSASQSIVPKEDCCICLGEVENRGKIACEHKFCFDCIHNWSKVTNTCPICKLAFKRITAATSSTDKTVGTKRKAPPRDIQVTSNIPKYSRN